MAALSSGSGSKGRQRSKDQERAKYLLAHGFYHGYRHHPWHQGINWPRLDEVGSAAYRRQHR